MEAIGNQWKVEPLATDPFIDKTRATLPAGTRHLSHHQHTKELSMTEVNVKRLNELLEKAKQSKGRIKSHQGKARTVSQRAFLKPTKRGNRRETI